jgi:hypothetical protein
MAEELEPRETSGPEQAEMFRQGVEPEVAPEATETPAPEPEAVVVEEAPVVEPDWLSAPAEPPPQAPPQQQYYEQPPPMYPQQPQMPQPAPVGDAALNAFVDNPDAWANSKIDSRLGAMVGPMQQQAQAVQHMMGMMMDNQVNEGVAKVDASIKRAYETFNKDASFRSSKPMQEKIAATLQGMREAAINEARGGNLNRLNTLSNLSEADIAGTLAYVRATAGMPSPGVGPLQVEGATVESSRSAVAEQSVEFDADTEAAIKRLGPAYRERLIKARLETDKAGDFEG